MSQKHSYPSECAEALRTFRWPDLAGWHGMPDCRLTDVVDAFRMDEDTSATHGFLGEAMRPLHWIEGHAVGFARPIRVWLDGDRAIALDTEILAPEEEARPLIDALGPPACRIEAPFGYVLLPDAEWVFPERGISLTIEPETHALLRLTAFPSTDLATFRRDYRFTAGPATRFPLDSSDTGGTR